MSKRALGFMNKALPITYNTYIGGVSATISTDSALATKLAISVARIENFTIVGSDIKCLITGGSYVIPSGAFLSDTNITYYTDSDGLVTNIGSNAFKNTVLLASVSFTGVITLTGNTIFENSRLLEAEFKNCTGITSSAFYYAYYLKTCYIPVCTNLGGSSINNAVFQEVPFNCRIYCATALATNNGGNPDGDLTGRISYVSYVTNYTAPNAVTTLATGTIYNTAVQLNFTAPTGSVNAISYYDCYANGVFKNTITASGGYITGLDASTSYSFTVYSVDIFYNKSLVSNAVTQSTNTTPVIADSKVVAAYKLSNGIDSKNGYNGTVGASISYVSGIDGNAANFNATSNSYISVADNNDFSFTNGTVDSAFSVSFKLKLTANTVGFLVSKSGNGFATNVGEWNIYNSSGNIIVLFSNKTSGYLASQFTTSLIVGIWYDIVMTYSGSGTNAGIKLYVGGVSKSYTSINSGSYTSMSNTTSTVNIGQEKASAGTYPLNGVLDEMYIFNSELTSTEATFLQTNYFPF